MSAQDLSQYVTTAQDRLRTQFPDVLEWLAAHNTSVREISTIQPASEPTHIQTGPSIHKEVLEQLQEIEQTVPAGLAVVTEEEQQEILKKLSQWTAHPTQPPAPEEQLYLAQQLTDLFGFTVSSELDGHRLPWQAGRVKASPHLRRFPSDMLSHHGRFIEAGIAQRRGAFGWFATGLELTPESTAREQYYFSVPLTLFPNWHEQSQELQRFFAFRKMVLINPVEKRAIVGVVGSIGPHQWLHYQFGASPEVVRWGRLWSPSSQGNAIVFFVDDPSDAVPLGVLNLEYQSA